MCAMYIAFIYLVIIKKIVITVSSGKMSLFWHMQELSNQLVHLTLVSPITITYSGL